MTTTPTTAPEVDLTPFRLPPSAVPCPKWCEYGEGHPYELEDAEGFPQRWHGRTLGLADVCVDVAALATWRGDHEEFGPLSIQMAIDGDAAGPELTSERALAVAGPLTVAAEWLEALMI